MPPQNFERQKKWKVHKLFFSALFNPHRNPRWCKNEQFIGLWLVVLISNDISHHPLPQADNPHRSTMTFNDKKTSVINSWNICYRTLYYYSIYIFVKDEKGIFTWKCPNWLTKYNIRATPLQDLNYPYFCYNYNYLQLISFVGCRTNKRLLTHSMCSFEQYTLLCRPLFRSQFTVTKLLQVSV